MSNAQPLCQLLLEQTWLDDRCKHSSLLYKSVDYSKKVLRLWLMNDGNKLVFVFIPGKQFLPYLMFVNKSRAYPCETPLRCSPLGQVPRLTHKRWPMLEKPAIDKHSSLLRTLVNYERKKVCNFEPGVKV